MRSLFLLLVISQVALSQNLAQSFPTGKGSRFVLNLPEAANIEVLVYVASSTHDSVDVEMAFSTNLAGIPLKLWQQSQLQMRNGQAVPTATFLQTNLMSQPERFQLSDLGKTQDLQISDFVLVSPDSVKKYLVGEEAVETPAGTVRAKHYRQNRGEQTLDYWISDEAKPIGLVKLKSNGKHPFDLTLGALIKNVPRKINPATAVPLSAEGRGLLDIRKPLSLQ